MVHSISASIPASNVNVNVDPTQGVIAKLQAAAKDLEEQEAILNNPSSTAAEKAAAAKAAAGDINTINAENTIIQTNLASGTPNPDFVAFAQSEGYIALFGTDGNGGLMNTSISLDDGTVITLKDVANTPGYNFCDIEDLLGQIGTSLNQDLDQLQAFKP